MHEEAAELAVRLIATGFLPREDKTVIRALTDQPFRDELDRRLAACGLVLLDNPYAAHVGVAVAPQFAKGVFGQEDRWISNSLGLSKAEITLLVILWALLILPKRERQLARTEAGGQEPLLAAHVPIDRVSREYVLERTLIEDFKEFWSQTYIRQRLTILNRHKFVVLQDGKIFEGPRLDLIMDYAKMAPRIKQQILANYPKITEARRQQQLNTGSQPVDDKSPQEDRDV